MSHARDRAFVIVAVLVVTSCALLVGTSLLFIMQAQITAESGARDRVQSRLLAMSGSRLIMQALNGQREQILDGELPRLDDEYVIYEAGDRTGLVRIVLDAQGRRLEPESSKLDLNSIDAATLASFEFIDDATARSIVDLRDRAGAVHSIADVLAADGVTPEMLYGPLDEAANHDDALGFDRSTTERVADRFHRDAAADAPRGLADLVTVYAVGPALQRSGALRINLDVPWSDDLAQRVDERFGDGAATVLQQLFEQGRRFESDARIIEALIEFDVRPEEWSPYLDGLTTDEGPHHFGRVDLNTARAEVLAALPGLDAEMAAQIVRTRSSLGADERATIAWPAIEGIVPVDAYRTLAGRITTRSWTYRIRFVAGERDENAEDDEADRLFNAVAYEIVIDLADPRPRLAYVRDVTLLPMAGALASAATDIADGATRPGATRSAASVTMPTTDDEVIHDVDRPDADLDLGRDDFGLGELDLGADRPLAPRDGGTRGPASSGTSGTARRIGRWTTR